VPQDSLVTRLRVPELDSPMPQSVASDRHLTEWRGSQPDL